MQSFNIKMYLDLNINLTNYQLKQQTKPGELNVNNVRTSGAITAYWLMQVMITIIAIYHSLDLEKLDKGSGERFAPL